MQFQVETDNHIENRRELAEYVESVVRDAVDRYAERLTHVEAHLGDVTGADKSSGNDKRCLLEARISGVKNIAVSNQAETLHLAIDGAVEKLRHALDSTVGKLHAQRRAEGLGHAAEALLPSGGPDADEA